jgi:hypothetical protein
LLNKLHSEKKARKLRKRQEQIFRDETERKLQVLRNKKKEELDKFALEEFRRKKSEAMLKVTSERETAL